MIDMPLLLAVDGGTIAVYLIGLALSVGLAVAAQALQKRGKRDPNQPIPTQVLQGGFIPRVIGRRRIAPTVLALGARYVQKSGGGSGKNKAPSTYNFYESAWHGLCVGPAYAIRRIWIDGVPAVWGGTITRETTPSGSFVPVGTSGFYVYWGDEVQPASSLVDGLIALNDSTLPNGTGSGWPFLCYVAWQAVNLGTQPIWPQIEYEVEVRIQPNSFNDIRDFAATPYLLADGDLVTPGTEEVTFFAEQEIEFEETGTWTGDNVAPAEGSVISPPSTGSNVVRIFTRPPDFPILTWSGTVSDITVKLIGPSAQEIVLFQESPAGILYNGSVQNFGMDWTGMDLDISSWPNSFYADLDVAAVDVDEIGTWTLRVEITSDFAVGVPAGGAANYLALGAVLDLQPPSATNAPAGSWIEDGDQIGANPADLFKELLCQPFPHGAGADESHLDTTSFTAWHDAALADVLPANVFAANGELAEDVLAQILSDHGYFLSYNPNEGCGEFLAQPIRSGMTPLVVAAEQNVGSKPEVETPLLEQPFDRVIFTFPDKNRDYAETAIVVDEDGQASLIEVQKAVKSPLYTATDYTTARVLAETKSQEDLPGNTGFKLELNRDANMLWPGLSIRIDEIDPEQEAVLKILEVKDQQNTKKIEVTAVEDNYEAAVSAYVGTEPPQGGSANTSTPTADTVAALFEVPTVLLQTRQTRVIVMRVRGSEQVTGSAIYFSQNGTSYQFNSRVQDVFAGGTLDAELPATDPFVIDQGPVITAQLDIDQVEDLTGNDADWRAGRQVAVIGDELFFVKRIVPTAVNKYRLEGLIRARLGTARASHAVNAQVYIFSLTSATDLSDTKIVPGQTLYCKPAPFTPFGELSLSAVTARTKTIRGNGVVPDPVSALRITGPVRGVAVYHTGDDVVFEWGYTNFEVPGTGAGLYAWDLGAGVAPAYGTFEVIVRDAGNNVVATYGAADGVTSTGWTYANATLLGDLGGETNFSIEVRNVNGGFRSAAKTMQVTFS